MSAATLTSPKNIPTAGKKKRRKKKRDPTKPKRPLSAYIFYANEKRPEFRSTYPDESLMSISKRIAETWATVTDRSVYESKAAEAKKIYHAAMEEWRAKQPPKIKRPRTAYALFMQDIRSTLAAEFPDKGPRDLMVVVASRWKASDEATKNKYKQLADQDKERYARESSI